MIRLKSNLSNLLKPARPVFRVLVVTMVLLFASFSSKANSPAVLLMPFDNASGTDQYDTLASGMPDILTACLSQFADQILVIERSAVDHTMDELGLSIEAYTNAAEHQHVGQIIGADFIVRGSFTRANGALTIEAITFNVIDATLVASVTATLSSEAIIEQICGDLAAPLAAKLASIPAQAAPIAVENVEEQALMMEGLGHYYTSDFIAAIAPFLKLVRIAQDNESAQYWLGKSFESAGMTDFAAVQLGTYLEQFPQSYRSKEIRAMVKSLTE